LSRESVNAGRDGFSHEICPDSFPAQFQRN
jgi:hypothetical protein